MPRKQNLSDVLSKRTLTFSLIHTLCPGEQQSYLHLGIFFILKFVFVYDPLTRTITGQYIIAARRAQYVTRITDIDEFTVTERFNSFTLQPTAVSLRQRLGTKPTLKRKLFIFHFISVAS